MKDSEKYKELIDAIIGNHQPKNKFAMLNWLYEKYNASKSFEEYVETKKAKEAQKDVH